VSQKLASPEERQPTVGCEPAPDEQPQPGQEAPGDDQRRLPAEEAVNPCNPVCPRRGRRAYARRSNDTLLADGGHSSA
jgi:hypothetical protein